MSAYSDNDVVIVAAKRTAMGSFGGSLSTVPAPELGAAAIKASIEQAGIAVGDIDEVIMGHVLPAGVGQAPARQASLGAGIPESVPTTTINKMCGSGMKAVMQAFDAIKAESCELMVAGGQENMSLAPYIVPKARTGYRLGHGELLDHMFWDGLEDKYTGKLMGKFADENSQEDGLTREAMDEYTLRSLERAQAATNEGWFKEEITPFSVKSRKGEVIFDKDELPGQARPEKIPSLRPAFDKDGVVTAANSSAISDGAAAVVLCSGKVAKEKGLSPLAVIRATASHAEAPAKFTHAPCGAMEKVLKKTGWSSSDVDLFEVNEAFAMVAMTAMNAHDIPAEKINIHGGAVALGHPVGASGARIIATLIYALKKEGKTKGLASLCIGGGEATAVTLELV
ncbi:acetyl-CoA acetyltransferase [Oleiphilus sp. HI0071]|nr:MULTISPECIES: thiolase family protein [unclassified Oleiphilus]KZY67223.1 acetyl-CoA acetyltransferase [Oleiphilus sp. HI0065]KZY78959.1 acetyl-CoA acetyltransferase [Oleiphilus sp. HI0071]KZY91901.1 acetyl-CoA acetyltransferase [Oleiphilus sp. HI0073]KZZ57911.1 acetyl-CoA acetyltransferase [Oleiphilus sp. HI0122]KZZ78383.1 acetyl-CoA acetyltransferase [Oleiphilus sp. HI0130]KZZ81797.1 acetyl-CoA acetyltransferase [Oleiphilus sp. HI0133]